MKLTKKISKRLIVDAFGKSDCPTPKCDKGNQTHKAGQQSMTASTACP